MISIVIPVTHGKYLNEVFNSINKNSYQDFEVIVVNSSEKPEISKIINSFNFLEIKVPSDTKALKARYIGHLNAKGDYELLLDETRVIADSLLKKLNDLDYDMVIIGEKEIIQSYWTYLADLDKNLNEGIGDPLENGYVLPRYFKKDVIDKAFEKIKQKLPMNIFEKASYAEHHIIFYESYQISKSIFYLKDKLIYHYGDNSILEIIKKYHKYGLSSRTLYGTSYEFTVKYSSHKRRHLDFYNKIKLSPLYLIRGISYFIGSLGI
ncbi:MAG: glycosyltransferase [Candidatus Nanopusillus acidilobi]